MPPFALMQAMHCCAELIEEYDRLYADAPKAAQGFFDFLKYFPKEYHVDKTDFHGITLDDYIERSKKLPTVPLQDIITDCPKAIMDLVLPLFNLKQYFS